MVILVHGIVTYAIFIITIASLFITNRALREGLLDLGAELFDALELLLDPLWDDDDFDDILDNINVGLEVDEGREP
ncbi:MAG: hypothetical protein M1819_002105 [Sarea resinae]|nr:MAG: hypothetical protein M1819_002105 [Sarea resinae]